MTLRVLMLGNGWFPAEVGGLERYYRALLEALPEATGVVLGPGPDAPARVSVVATPQSSMVSRSARFLAAAIRAGRSADVIDAHFALYAAPFVLTLGRRKPLLVHFQGPWAAESAAAGEPHSWRIAAKRTLERAVYRRADRIVTLTHAFKTLLVDTYGVSEDRVVVIRPAVDSAHFHPGDREAARAHFALPPGAFVVCCARRLVPRMGIDVLLTAWRESLATSPGAHLLIAGTGPLEEELRDAVRAAGGDWATRVRILGRISDADLLWLYRAADVNVVPSREFEGFGLTVLEAAACGTPSLVSDAGGLIEAVDGLGEDLVVPAGDPAALAERLSRANDGGLPSRLSTRRWAEGHNWPEVAAQHRTLLELVRRDRQRP